MNKNTKRLVLGLLAVAIIGLCAFLFVFGSDTKEVTICNREMPTATDVTDELTKGLVVKQNFVNTTENIKEIALVFSRLYYLDEDDNDVPINIELLCGNDVLASTSIVSNDIPDQHRVYLNIDNPINGYVGKKLTLKIYETYGSDTGVALLISNEIKNESLSFGNRKMNGSICFSVIGE